LRLIATASGRVDTINVIYRVNRRLIPLRQRQSQPFGCLVGRLPLVLLEEVVRRQEEHDLRHGLGSRSRPTLAADNDDGNA
jgi:hypothetical protein